MNTCNLTIYSMLPISMAIIVHMLKAVVNIDISFVSVMEHCHSRANACLWTGSVSYIGCPYTTWAGDMPSAQGLLHHCSRPFAHLSAFVMHELISQHCGTRAFMAFA